MTLNASKTLVTPYSPSLCSTSCMTCSSFARFRLPALDHQGSVGSTSLAVTGDSRTASGSLDAKRAGCVGWAAGHTTAPLMVRRAYSAVTPGQPQVARHTRAGRRRSTDAAVCMVGVLWLASGGRAVQACGGKGVAVLVRCLAVQCSAVPRGEGVARACEAVRAVPGPERLRADCGVRWCGEWW